MSKAKQETYQSSTLGAIPLSFTGRRLLQNLREEVEDLLKGRASIVSDEWKPLSRARGKLALYISELEAARPDLTQVPDSILLEEIGRRFYRARMVDGND